MLEQTNIEEQVILGWLRSVRGEVSYWRGWLAHKGGGDSGDDYSLLTSSGRRFPFTHLVTPHPELTVLDVGAGPISVIGTAFDGGRVKLTACDPLAPLYNLLLDNAGVKPETRTRFALGESLCDVFPAESFDMVHMRNALDHAFHPLCIVQNMLAVCKTGGMVHLTHHENEAEFENYVGMHQWNVSIGENGAFILWDKNGKHIDISDALASYGRVECERQPGWSGRKAWIVATIRKEKPIEPDRSVLGCYDELLHTIVYYAMIRPEHFNLQHSTRYRAFMSLFYKKPTVLQKVIRELTRPVKQIGHFLTGK